MEDCTAIIHKLTAPLRAESRAGYRDSVISGGSLASYVARWAAEGERAALLPADQRAFGSLAQLLADYAQADPQGRRQRISQALQLLEGIRTGPGGTRVDLPPPEAPAAADPGLLAELDAPFPIGQAGWMGRLAKLGLTSHRDLLYHFPRQYAPVRHLRQLQDGERACVRVKAGERAVNQVRVGGRHFMKYSLQVQDETGYALVTSFAAPSHSRQGKAAWSPLQLKYEPGTPLYIEGNVRRFGGLVELQYLEGGVDRGELPPPGALLPIYPLTEGLYQGQLRPVIRRLVERFADALPETLPPALVSSLHLAPRGWAVRAIHYPASQSEAAAAHRRLAFDEFFELELALALRKSEVQQPGRGYAMPAPPGFLADLERELPFPLTAAQRRVIGEIATDMGRDQAMNRLLQGDVGSGKTVVALAAIVNAVRNGYQAALMAPTEILASQHASLLSDWLPRFGITSDLLMGALTGKGKQRVREAVASGEIPVVIGTHALVEAGVSFHRLGLVVVDEQHRFGVIQRSRLRDKGQHPDLLVMTATPIPRTLAMTVHGDLDVSLLDELPPGRKPVRTTTLPLPSAPRADAQVRQAVHQGRQAYIVCPLVEESAKLEAEAATRLYEHLRQDVFPNLQVGLVHGRMKAPQRHQAMEEFRAGRLQVLCATSVIEVGVDVPQATVMVIHNAERFGLAQLHQLRGRVGRGGDQAVCVLLVDPRAAPTNFLPNLPEDQLPDSVRRMAVLTRTCDGFEIAEADLRLRGPGEFAGVRQHGLPELKVADLLADQPILVEAQAAALQLVRADPPLSRPEHAALARRAQAILARIEALAP